MPHLPKGSEPPEIGKNDALKGELHKGNENPEHDPLVSDLWISQNLSFQYNPVLSLNLEVHPHCQIKKQPVSP